MIKREAPILDAIADALGRDRLALVRRRSVGLFLAVADIGAALAALKARRIFARVVRVGITGEPDLDVVVGGQLCAHCAAPVHPRVYGIEVKSGKGEERPDQEIYRLKVAARVGIDHAIVRSVDEAEAFVGRG
jgi:hypothetical protein